MLDFHAKLFAAMQLLLSQQPSSRGVTDCTGSCWRRHYCFSMFQHKLKERCISITLSDHLYTNMERGEGRKRQTLLATPETALMCPLGHFPNLFEHKAESWFKPAISAYYRMQFQTSWERAQKRHIGHGWNEQKSPPLPSQYLFPHLQTENPSDQHFPVCAKNANQWNSGGAGDSKQLHWLHYQKGKSWACSPGKHAFMMTFQPSCLPWGWLTCPQSSWLATMW